MAQTHHIEDVGKILLSVQNDLKSLRNDLASVGGSDAGKFTSTQPVPQGWDMPQPRGKISGGGLPCRCPAFTLLKAAVEETVLDCIRSAGICGMQGNRTHPFFRDSRRWRRQCRGGQQREKGCGGWPTAARHGLVGRICILPGPCLHAPHKSMCLSM
jgi:hypothetical protein